MIRPDLRAGIANSGIIPPIDDGLGDVRCMKPVLLAADQSTILNDPARTPFRINEFETVANKPLPPAGEIYAYGTAA